MEESGSLGLDGLIAQEAQGYFKGVDAVTISDNYWLGTTKPVLTYGLRGVNYYQITVNGPAADLHSGLFGGIVAEPMTDLVKLLATLVDTKGKILIKGIDEQVKPLTEQEDKLYDDIEFDVEVLNQATGGSIPITLTFEKELKTSVLLLPVGRGDDGAHSTNEKLDISNYIEGTKTLSAYLHYYAQGSK
ncbi:metallodipeptidase [Cyberlindnera jadinii NRRL Y-1542]|uniref:Zn-dependent exopeptidase n=1 Tax=Cyberlindnera jadinii (strain ATCC 18201 / CBS 1600 / BCRC 20928 / JCM 3617 / NBRC 0987 / NRRL Y-1542) TaxID=983966 RepID=A0A1E4S3U7_CYBJN|nr:Zn-dependent exopeptidase [Cyberlindnera jadinii NRRL Y-1542]ODV74174.1 Zn-dependent exopeptidase [Cyberlindnera jadinii NRRL Y-1542]